MSDVRGKANLRADLAQEALRIEEDRILREQPDSEAAAQIREHRAAGHMTTQG